MNKLNFDAINGAAVDALQRIGTALIEAFEGRHSDATLEIADATHNTNVAGEARAAALTFWNAADGWRDALLGQVSPWLARTTRWALLPYSASTRPLRRCLQGSAPLSAQQTYPT